MKHIKSYHNIFETVSNDQWIKIQNTINDILISLSDEFEVNIYPRDTIGESGRSFGSDITIELSYENNKSDVKYPTRYYYEEFEDEIVHVTRYLESENYKLYKVSYRKVLGKSNNNTSWWNPYMNDIIMHAKSNINILDDLKGEYIDGIIRIVYRS